MLIRTQPSEIRSPLSKIIFLDYSGPAAYIVNIAMRYRFVHNIV